MENPSGADNGRRCKGENAMTETTGRERQKRIRAAIRAKAKVQPFVRKVWLLPSEMSSRIIDYQEDQLLPSEVEAARRLLDIGLQLRGM